MKQLIFLGGPMGVGKTTVGKALADALSPSAFLDGDWCWDLHPFTVSAENKAMVLDNCAYLLRSFLQNTSISYVLFSWVLHEQSIIDSLLERLADLSFQFSGFSLVASPEVLRGRLAGDIAAGLRSADVIARSLERLPLYEKLSTVLVDTSGKSISTITAELAGQIKKP